MSELRVDPADAGPRIVAALMEAAAALSAPAAIMPPEPAGIDPVSITAANRVATNAAKLSSQLAGGISRLITGGNAAVTALQRYIEMDADGAALVGGSGSPAAAAVSALSGIPDPPAVDIPDVPIDVLAALATVPGAPDVVDDALNAGAGESGLHAHAASWDVAAQGLSQSAHGIQQLAGSLPASWEGQTSTNLSARLQNFGQWMETSAAAAGAHADTAREVASHWSTAVADHPRAQTYRETQQKFVQAASRASAGDVGAAADATRLEGELVKMKTKSAKTMTTYGQGAGGAKEADHPGDSPKISGDGDHLPDKAAKDFGAADDPLSGDGSSDPASQSGQATGQSMQSILQTMMSIPSQLAGALGQSFGQVGQQVQQVGQQASQMASQLGGGLGGGMPSGGSGGSPRNPLSKLGSGDGLDGLGGGGGAGGGGDSGRTLPASLPEQLAPPAPAPPASTGAVPTGSVPRAATGGGGSMMPMGMMPHGNKGAEGKEIDRNQEWFPDEQLVKDTVEVSEPIAGQRKRVRPTEK